MTSDKPHAATQLVFPFMAPVYRFGTCISWPMVRIMAGLWLVPHGAQKVFGGIEQTAASFSQMGLEPALFLAYLVAYTEFLGGILIALGLLTRLAAAGATILLFVAAVAVHLPNGFFIREGGYEYAVMWMVLTLAIFLRGGGPFSLDARIGKEL